MRGKLILLSLLVLFSCQKKEATTVQVIGHAGMGLQFSGSVYHDNSAEAFDLALNMKGCDGIEMDVRMSIDGDLWAFHDENLTTETNASGCLESKTYPELSEIKYKGFGKERLSRLKDLHIPNDEKVLFLDLKHLNACTGQIHDENDFVDALGDFTSSVTNKERIRLVTSNPEWIFTLLSTGLPVYFSGDEESENSQVIQNFPQISGLVIKNSAVSKERVNQYQNQGFSVYLYEVRSPKALKEVRSKNPTGVMSDDVQGAIVELK